MERGKHHLGVRITPEIHKELYTIATRNNVTVSELIRKYIEQGLTIEKTKSDIDFIRINMREEIESVLEPYMRRQIKLHIKVGIVATSLCYFTSSLIYTLIKDKTSISYDTMFANARRKAAAYLGVKDDAVDDAYKDIMHND